MADVSFFSIVGGTFYSKISQKFNIGNNRHGYML